MSLDLARFSQDDQERINKALAFATHAHRHQKRIGGNMPYIVHPVAVAQLLVDEFNADAATVMAGLLHDVVEDTDASLDDIEREFGSEVKFLVDGATDYGKNDGNQHIADKIERAKYSKVKALKYAEKDERVLLVKIADRMNNMTTAGVHTPRGQVGYSRDTLAFHVVQARKLGFEKQAVELERMCNAFIDRWKDKSW